MLLAICGLSQDPGDTYARTQLDTRFAPFYHGVASGDPLPNGVIIWTRVTPSDSGQVNVDWRMATDTSFNNVVTSGSYQTNANQDYTVKVDVTGLQPGTWYYYQFENEGRKSVVGRTFTAPTSNVDSLRFGIVSCSKYSSGYFNVYGRMARRNDLHAILHLGDYIYEDGSSATRPHDPNFEVVNLEDYRLRHSQYKMDQDLQCLHQMYPFITVWDDHESANDSWRDGADAHQPASEGLWIDRKTSAIQAYYEWMPIRQTDPQNQERIYRKISYGNLIDFLMLDTRLIGRDEQASGGAIDDTTRSLLGPDQLAWLSAELQGSNATWKILGQQVMMAPLEVFGTPVNPDQWDGYRAERQRLYDSISTHNIENVVVLTGDIHTFWANDLPGNNYDPNTGANSVGVEFVATSVTSGNPNFGFGVQLIQLANPHIKYANLEEHGYIVLHVTADRAQGDYFNIGTIDNPGEYSESAGPYYYVKEQEGFLREAQAASQPDSSVMAIQPSKTPPNDTLVSSMTPVVQNALLGIYPNPSQASCTVNFYLHKAGAVRISVRDIQGRIVLDKDTEKLPTGLHYRTFSVADLPSGIYLLQLQTGEHITTRQLIKD